MAIYRGTGGSGTANDVGQVEVIAGYALDAETSATEASSSASAAATSASNAATSETNASTSETNASASETAAAASASAASTSETNAATSASNAATSETNAAASETAAATSETNAAASASSASTSASTATTQAGLASSSASAAATSESNAATSETNAASSASAASTSASNASSSASAASSSASAAATSASNAEAAYDSFDDRYLGPKASDPTLDNDSNALLTGALYWNTSANEMRAYNGSSWQTTYNPSTGTVTSVAATVPTGWTVSGSPITSSGTLAFAYDTGYEAYTTAEASKLAGIEAGADVTDTTNVTAAGALMDSEVTNLAQVKAFDSSDYATAAQGTLADSALQSSDIGVSVQAYSAVLAGTTASFTSADEAKLDGIATNANNYSHPSHPGDDFSVDTGALTGATVVSDIDINVTTDTLGHVTDANGTVSTRTLTAADIGAQPAGTYLSQGGSITSGTVTTLTSTTANITTVDLGNWTITESSGILYFATSGVNKMKLDASGNLTITGDLTAGGTV